MKVQDGRTKGRRGSRADRGGEGAGMLGGSEGLQQACEVTCEGLQRTCEVTREGAVRLRAALSTASSSPCAAESEREGCRKREEGDNSVGGITLQSSKRLPW